MKIIAIRGTANVGKSTTIREVYSILIEQHEYNVINADFLQNIDIRVVIEKNGVKVGIESQGDPNSRLEESLNEFERIGCEIIVCATRTSGMTVRWVNAKRPLYSVNWKEKQPENVETRQFASNLNMAREIVAEIEEYLQLR